MTEVGGVHVGEALPFSAAIRIIELQEARKDVVRVEEPRKFEGYTRFLNPDNINGKHQVINAAYF